MKVEGVAALSFSKLHLLVRMECHHMTEQD